MLKKSCLLEYLIKCADLMRQDDGKNAISANYFVVAALVCLADADDNKFPDELNNDEGKEELSAVRNLFSKYDIGYREASLAIMDAIRDEGYKSYIDELLFSKTGFNAEARAKMKNMEYIDAVIYLELIIAEPTAIIKKYISEKNLEKNAQKNADEEAASSMEELIKKVEALTNESDKESDNESGEKSDTPDDKNVDEVSKSRKARMKSARTRMLSSVVRRTRNIQSILLENVYGQDQAINTFVSGYFQAQLMAGSRKETTKPQATFLFAGPPGVGKTFLAEKVAEALKLPYMRFDMSEYASEGSVYDFCGTDKSYKACRPGNVTGFVEDNPKCVLLFDEIEKAHINIIHLFLQMLDAGRLRDNYSNEEVAFTEAVIILTTNVGKNLYDDPSIVNLSAVPRKKILKALSSDIDPIKNIPLFPAAICSRFASGNVVMFNHLEANNLYTIAERELWKNIKGLEASTGMKITIDEKVPTAIM